MERREFLAALGTAATVSSASQVFAQIGGGSPQKVTVALYVALEAKPGKEEAVAEFLRQNKALVEAEPATIASAFVSDPQPPTFWLPSCPASALQAIGAICHYLNHKEAEPGTRPRSCAKSAATLRLALAVENPRGP
jgi:hypothetical protein